MMRAMRWLAGWRPAWRRQEVGPTMLIVGLGNPGSAYAATRHNVGFRCIDRLAARNSLKFNLRRANSEVARGQVAGQLVALVKPQTFMNLSGQAVKRISMSWGVPPAAVLIVYDDVDLPVGTIRLRERGSPGTHNGMKSVVHELRTTEVPRLRIGVGAASGKTDLADHVLSKATEEEEAATAEAIERACDAIELILRRDVATAMNQFNTQAKPPANALPKTEPKPQDKLQVAPAERAPAGTDP